jgi:uncharacterized membrane protein
LNSKNTHKKTVAVWILRSNGIPCNGAHRTLGIVSDSVSDTSFPFKIILVSFVSFIIYLQQKKKKKRKEKEGKIKSKNGIVLKKISFSHDNKPFSEI